MKSGVVRSPLHTACGPEGVQSLAATPESARSPSRLLHRSSRASVCEDQSPSSKGSPLLYSSAWFPNVDGALQSMRSLGRRDDARIERCNQSRGSDQELSHARGADKGLGLRERISA